MGNMKANRKFIDGEEAVSAVIGVILMVAITVAIAATVYVYVSGIIGPGGKKTPTLTCNVYDTDADANEVIWYVSGIENGPLGDDEYDWSLLNESGGNETGVTVKFNDNNDDDYVNSGDTFSVTAATDGKYTFVLTSKDTGETIYKSSLTQY